MAKMFREFTDKDIKKLDKLYKNLDIENKDELKKEYDILDKKIESLFVLALSGNSEKTNKLLEDYSLKQRYIEYYLHKLLMKS